MLCDQCADFVGGVCASRDTQAKALFGASQRDQFEFEDCHGFREASERPGEDETLERCVLSMLERRGESEEWEAAEGETPETLLMLRAEDMGKAWKHGPRHVEERALEEWVPLADDLRARLIRLIVDCPELDGARGRKYRLTWRTGKWTIQGGPCWGASKPIPQPNREKYQIEETWEITLSLPVWLLLDDDGKDRLLHHELMHAATNERGHPVAEWPETVARYGLLTRDQAVMALAGIGHASARKRVEVWGLLPTGQTQLFIGEGMERIEVEEG